MHMQQQLPGCGALLAKPQTYFPAPQHQILPTGPSTVHTVNRAS